MTATLRDLLNVVFRFRRALVKFWIIAVLAILIYYTQAPRKYDSKARILVSLGSESAGRAEYLNNSNLQLIQREQQIHNEQQILLSDHVLLTTAKWILGESTPGDPAPALDENVLEARRFLTGEEPEPTLLLKAVKLISKGLSNVMKMLPFGNSGPPIPESKKLATTLSKSLDAKTIFSSDALDVTFRYRDARVAQTVLKLVLAAYINHHISVFQSAAESDLLKSELDHSVDEYQKRLNEMANFMETRRVFSEDTQINSFIQQRQQISQTLGDALAERQSASARIANFNTLNSTLKRYETYSTTETRSKLHEELISKLNDAQIQQQQILNNHPAESRVYQDQVQVLQRIRTLLASQPAQVVDQREDRRSGASELVEEQLISATAAEKSAQARADQLKNELSSVNVSINEYAKNLPGYDLIKLNLNFSKEQSEKMGQAYLNSRLRVLTAQNAITDISVIDAPSWDPETPTPKKSMIAILSIALLLLGSVAVVLSGLILDSTINDRNEATILGIPIGAIISKITHEEWSSPRLLGSDTEKQFARIYSSIRKFEKPGVVIGLIGAEGAEGVSLLGQELAKYLAHDRLSHVALLDCTATSATTQNDSDGLTLLSLPLTGQQSERVSSLAAQNALQEWRKEFDYIVLASSVGEDIHRLVDALPMATASYLVVEAGRTRKDAAAKALDLLKSYGVEGVQLILNKYEYYVPEWLVKHV